MSLKDAINKRTQVLHEENPTNFPINELLSEKNENSGHYENSRMSPANQIPNRTFQITKEKNRIVSIGEGVVLKGDISDCDKAEIQGKFEGTINANSIYVAENGIIKGDIECDELSVSGSVEGKVTSRKTLDIASSGKVVGEIAYEKLLVTSGGIVLGTLENQTDKPQNPDIG